MRYQKYLTVVVAFTVANVLSSGLLYAHMNVAYLSDLSASEVVKIHHYLSDANNRQKNDPKALETRYSWQHMSEFYFTAQIKRDGDVKTLPKALDKKIEEITFIHNGKTQSIKEHLNTSTVDALLVICHGKIVYETYRGMQATDKHIWWSSGKVIGATMLAILEDEGKVDTSKAVTAYLPELKGSVWESVSVQETLDMATGLNGTEHDEPNHDSRTNPKQVWYRWAVSIGMYPNISGNKESPIDIIKSMKRRYSAYTKFEYNSINTFVINRIVEAVANKPLHAYFTQKVWSQIGAKNDGYVVTTPHEGYGLFYGMMNSTLEDMGKFGMIFTPSAQRLTSTPILSQKVVQKMQNQPHKEMYAKAFMGQLMIKKFQEKKISNHYQWDAIFEDGDMYKSGFGGQGLYVSPSQDMVVVWFGTGDGSTYEEPLARAIVQHYKTK
jgi:CubicO group peptidase (beta-lactamase class C family)